MKKKNVRIFLYALILLLVVVGGIFWLLNWSNVRAVNLNYSEDFTTDTYEDAINTDANWDTVGNQIQLVDLGGGIYQATADAVSLTIDSTANFIYKATLTAVDDASTDVDFTITYFLSNNGGTTWNTVTSGSEYVFNGRASDLRWKATLATADTSKTPTISSITISYNDNQAPATPILALPAGGATGASTYPVFSFSTTDADSDDIYYVLEIYTDSNYLNKIREYDLRKERIGWSQKMPYTSGDTATYTITAPDALSTKTTYYWRVRAFDVYGYASAYSAGQSFTTRTTEPLIEVFDSTINLNLTASHFFSNFEFRRSPEFRHGGLATFPAISTFSSATAVIGNHETTGYVAFDGDGDGDLDIALTSTTTPKYCSNNGSGVFSCGDDFGTSSANFNYPIAGDFDGDNDLDVVIEGTLYKNNGSGVFDAGTIIITNVTAVTSADIDNDGDLDLLFGRYGDVDKIYLNNGSAVFTESSVNPFVGEIAASGRPVVADFNGDGYLDIYQSYESGNATVFLNDGDFSFTKTTFNALNLSLNSTVAVDFDLDGDMDILNPGLIIGYTVPIFLNDGAGNFTVSDLGFSASLQLLTVGDIDNDNDMDIVGVTGSGGGNNELYIYRNKGDATFSDAETAVVDSAETITGLIVADFDKDRNADILVGRKSVGGGAQDYIFINTNTSDGLVKNSSMPAAGEFITSMFDADSDGDLDLVVLKSTVGNGEIWINDGSQTYTKTVSFGSNAVNSMVGDFDDDDDLDVVILRTGDQNDLYLNDGSGTFTLQSNALGTYNRNSFKGQVFDVENDGDLDVVIANSLTPGGEVNEVWLNDGTANFTEVVTPFINHTGATYSEDNWTFDVGDIDNDGDIDVIFVGDEFDDNAEIFKNNGDGTFAQGVIAFDQVYWEKIALGDLDGDKDLDAFCVSHDGSHASAIYLNDGFGNFTFFDNLGSTTADAREALIYDLDRNGYKDIVVARGTSGAAQNYVYYNYGGFIFDRADLSETDQSFGLLIGDYNLDGDNDIIVQNFTEGTCFIYETMQTFKTNLNAKYLLQSAEIDDTAETIKSTTITISGSQDSNIVSNYYSTSGGDPLWNTDLSPTGITENINAFGTTADASTYYIVLAGDNGTLVSSANYGYDWTDISPAGETANINDMFGAYLGGNAALGIIGDGGTYQYSLNAGATWTDVVNIPAPVNLNGFATFTGMDWIIFGDGGAIYKSTNFAASWSSPVSGTVENLNSGIAKSSTIFYAVGDGGTIIKSTDGADTWSSLTSGTVENLHKIDCYSTTLCIAVGDSGTILKTTDGTNWTAKTSGTTEDLQAVVNKKLDTDDNWWAVGTNGTILQSTDKGETWASIINDTTETLTTVYDNSNYDGVVVAGYNGLMMQRDVLAFESINNNVQYNFHSGPTLLYKILDGTTVSTSSPSYRMTSAVYNIAPATPTNSTPLDGTVGVDPEATTLTASAFSDSDVSDTHANSQWQISATSGDYSAPVYDSGTDNTNLVSITIPTATLSESTPYYWRVRYQDSAGSWSAYSTETSFTTGTTTTSTGRPAEPTVTIGQPYEDLNLAPHNPDINSIEWCFIDNSNNETQFILKKLNYEEINRTDTLNSAETGGVNCISQTNLIPNTEYSGNFVLATNGSVDSYGTTLSATYTLAEEPSLVDYAIDETGRLILTADVGDNSEQTKYSIYEATTASWLQYDSTLGEVEVYQTLAEWGDAGINVDGLDPGVYGFMIRAMNNDSIVTDLSEPFPVEITLVGQPSLSLTKLVGINTGDTYLTFGQVASAKGINVASILTPYENITNKLILFVGIIFALLLILLILNGSDKLLMKLKYLPNLFIHSFRKEKVDHVYKLINKMEKDECCSNRYFRHYRFFKYTSFAGASFVIAIVVKVMIVILTMGLLYVNIGVQSFVSASGETVKVDDVLTYQVEYTNVGDTKATMMEITDLIPEGTSYLAGQLSVNGTKKSDISYDDNAVYTGDGVKVFVGDLEPGEVGYMQFKVKVVGEDEQTIINQASCVYTEANRSITSNSVSNTIHVVNDVCGDYICGESETCQGCPMDCGECINETDCGNGIVETGEACDDGNFDNGDGCDEFCNLEVIEEDICGDNICSETETCQTCDQDCGECIVEPLCGNNIIEAGETCDDGNLLNNDGCNSSCLKEVVAPYCGDNICNNGETCETCSSDCGECQEEIIIPEEEGCEGDVCSVDLEEIENGETPTTSEPADNITDNEIAADIAIVNEIKQKDEWEKTDEEREIEVIADTENILNNLGLENSEIARQIVQNVLTLKKATIDNRVVEKVNDQIKEPVMAVATVAAVTAVATVGVTGASGVGLLSYLHLLFQPFMALFAGKKRKKWGVVYNSVTKKPIDLAIVRVYDSVSKRLVISRVTDKLGRYQFLLKPGKYYLTIDKKEFKFPSSLLNKAKTDGDFINVYYGNDFEVTEKDTAVSFPIALDPQEKIQTPRELIRLFVTKKGQLFFTLIGPVLAIGSFIINPQVWIGGAVLLHLGMFVAFRRLAVTTKPKSWGLIRDIDSKKPLVHAIVRVFDTKFNKLLDTQVTDNYGRYAFLVSNKEYYLTVDKPGYFPKRTNVYNLENEKTGYLAEDVYVKSHNLGKAVNAAQLDDKAFTMRVGLGRQTSEIVGGKQKVVRNDAEKFKGDIPNVNLNDMHEDYYEIDNV